MKAAGNEGMGSEVQRPCPCVVALLLPIFIISHSSRVPNTKKKKKRKRHGHCSLKSELCTMLNCTNLSHAHRLHNYDNRILKHTLCVALWSINLCMPKQAWRDVSPWATKCRPNIYHRAFSSHARLPKHIDLYDTRWPTLKYSFSHLLRTA